MSIRQRLCAIIVLAFSASVGFGQARAYFTEPSLSPDRKEIAFVSGGDIWTVPAMGGVAALLVSHTATEVRYVADVECGWPEPFLSFGSHRFRNKNGAQRFAF